MSRPLTEFELHSTPLRGLLLLARERGIGETRKDLIIKAVLEGQDPTPWWNAMRKLRRFSEYIDDRDDEITHKVATGRGIDQEDVGVEDLRWAHEEAKREYSRNWQPRELSRSEILTEIGKHVGFTGLTHLQIERRLSDEILSTSRLARVLARLGGASSSSPEREWYDNSSALRRLRFTGRFEGSRERDVEEAIDAAFGVSPARIARGFDHWSQGREDAPPPARHPSEVLNDLRGTERFRGVGDQEIIEAVEASTNSKFATTGDLENLLSGGTPKPRAEVAVVPEPPAKGKRWWDALRKVRTLKWMRGSKDHDIVSHVAWEDGIEPHEVTFRNLLGHYGRFRYHGVFEDAKVDHELARDEVLAELAKFDRYDSVLDAEGREAVATTEELRKRLRDLGGPSSSSPVVPDGVWDVMRRIRTLGPFGEMEDGEIFKEAWGSSPQLLLSLYKRERAGARVSDVAGVPRKLSREELLLELAKMSRYRDAPLPHEMSDEELENRLNLLGGPSSSHPRASLRPSQSGAKRPSDAMGAFLKAS